LTTKKISENYFLEIFSGSNGIVSAVIVLLCFLVATLLLLVIGRNPEGMYQALVQVVSGFDSRRGTWNVRYTGEWIAISIPLILCGLSMGFAAKSGLFNIGVEGQYIAGLTAAQVIAAFFPPVPFLHAAAAVLAAVIAGAAWGSFAGFLKARYRISEVVATIMMNYIALYLHRIITMRIPGSNSFRTPDFHVTASLSSPMLSSLTNGSRLNYGLWFTLAAVLIYWVVMEKTVFGYSLQAIGFNRDAAHYAGVSVKLHITLSMAIAGCFAGLAGASVSLGIFTHGRVLSSFDNYGFDAIAVALGGNCTAAGITIMGLLFGMLKSAQPLMQSRQIPIDITTIIMGLVVVFISLRAGIKIFVEWKMKNNFLKKAFEGSDGK
jgi:simple sugar transport system permease protein